MTSTETVRLSYNHCTKRFKERFQLDLSELNPEYTRGNVQASLNTSSWALYSWCDNFSKKGERYWQRIVLPWMNVELMCKHKFGSAAICVY